MDIVISIAVTCLDQIAFSAQGLWVYSVYNNTIHTTGKKIVSLPLANEG